MATTWHRSSCACVERACRLACQVTAQPCPVNGYAETTSHTSHREMLFLQQRTHMFWLRALQGGDEMGEGPGPSSHTAGCQGSGRCCGAAKMVAGWALSDERSASSPAAIGPASPGSWPRNASLLRHRSDSPGMWTHENVGLVAATGPGGGVMAGVGVGVRQGLGAQARATWQSASALGTKC